MKPVLIYGMPRSKSTALLYSCKRENIIDEPFRMKTFHRGKPFVFRDYYKYNSEIPPQKMNRILHSMSQPNSVTKYFGIHAFQFPQLRPWLEQAEQSRSHDMFIIERDREQMFLSYILAYYFGYLKTHEVPVIEDIVVQPDVFFILSLIIDCHIRYYPKRGKLVTLETMPESHFDINLNDKIESQMSHTRYQHITNIDECMSNIRSLIKFHGPEWDRKINQLDQS
jgi:hypothetical protein